MKNTSIAIMIILASFSSMVQASLRDNNSWYAGGKLGWSQFHNVTSYGDYLLNSDNLIYKNHLGMGIFGGYQVNSCFSLEMGYDWLDRIFYKTNDDVNSTFTVHGIQLTTKVNYPVSNSLDMYARLGGMMWRASYSSGDVINNHDSGVSPLFAGGVEWVMDDNFISRLEYQWTNNIGDCNTIGLRPDNGMLSFGISYRFGQQKSASATVSSTPISNAKMQDDRHFSLKSNVLFDFNEAILRPEGRQVLDQLSTKISDLNSTNYSVVVLGFTDRIGSSVYNNNLSDRRSRSVVEYLIQKGIPENRISSYSMGESNPITNRHCDDIEDKSKLIDCLAPDRRVEVEVKCVNKK